MFNIQDPSIAYQQLEQAIELEKMKEALPELENVVKKNMRWAIFFADPIFESKNKNSEFNLTYSFMEEAGRQITAQYGVENPIFFAPVVEAAFKGKQLSVFVDYEDCDVEIKVKAVDGSFTINPSVPLALALTYPDSDVVFNELVDGWVGDPQNKWVYDHMDVYDRWTRDVMSRAYSLYYQVGGYGRLIQDSHGYDYIAQINNNIGDCGSVFVIADERGISGHVEMY